MSIYSTIMCPKCKEGFIGISIAYYWNKVRFDCGNNCGYSKEIKLGEIETNFLEDIMNKRFEKEEKK